MGGYSEISVREWENKKNYSSLKAIIDWAINSLNFSGTISTKHYKTMISLSLDESPFCWFQLRSGKNDIDAIIEIMVPSNRVTEAKSILNSTLTFQDHRHREGGLTIDVSVSKAFFTESIKSAALKNVLEMGLNFAKQLNSIKGR